MVTRLLSCLRSDYSDHFALDIAAVSKPRGDDSDDRFVVTIEYDDGVDPEANQTGFKTRGRHLVSKVLMQACKTFGIDHLYDR